MTLNVAFDAALTISLLGLAASLIALYSKWQEKPRLRVFLPEDSRQMGDDQKCRWCFVHLAVENTSPDRFTRLLTYRQTAQRTRIKLEYRAHGGSDPKFAFEGRWSGNDEPVQYRQVNGQWVKVFEPSNVRLGRFMDVAVGPPEWVAVAVKVDGDEDCYGFTNESYFMNEGNSTRNHWRKEEYRLPKGNFIVTATAVSSEVSSRPVKFLLHNDGAALTDLWLDKPARGGLSFRKSRP